MSKPLYTLTGVEHRYDQRTVLRIPSLEIQEGEILTLVGPSGAGKSTLLRLLALLEAPAQGTLHLHLGEHPVTKDRVRIQEQRQIGMVFQRPILLSRSVRANVAYGLRLRGRRDAKDDVEAMLARVDMLDLADAHPQTLSGGELQRVALARALILEPRLLLLDEPTANLDPHNVRLIETLLREQHERYHTTLVIVTHNIFQAKRLATRVGLLLDGELVEIAPPASFFDAPRDPRTSAFISGDLVY
ncbi:MAG: ATP-binding cassette domain-containing protein [Anaerolineae bacterium]|nr:ATP-binding cassette domain-containing protein [Anaerolineae bacterium]